MYMVKPEDELPRMAEHILSLRISGWDSQMGIYLSVNSLKHTPVPDCVAMLSSLWERNSVKTVLAMLDLRGLLWEVGACQDLHSSAKREMSQAEIESWG